MAIALIEPTVEVSNNSQPSWHKSAPRGVATKYREGDAAAGWTAWKKHLSRRKRPEAPAFLAGKRPPLFWGAGEISDFGFRISDWEGEASIGNPKSAILSRLGSDAPSVESPSWEPLAAAYALPELAQSLTADEWWELVQRLQALAVDAQQMRVDVQAEPRDVLRQQWLAGELPLALGYLFPELISLRALRKPARQALSEALVELTDGQGLPHGRLLPAFLPLWASWTRARWMGERMHRGCWSSEAEVQYQWLVRHAIRLTGADGRLMLSETNDSRNRTADAEKLAWPRELYATALELVGDPWDCAAAAAMLPQSVVPRRAKFKQDDLPDVSLESEWAGVAVLATGWQRSAARVAVSYVEEAMKFEVSAGRERLLAGDLTCRTTCDGEPVRVSGEWEQICWQSDKKCDYLELGVTLSHGLRLERHLLLARDDRVLYLADAVLAADAGPRKISHAIELPIAAGATWQPEAETRDGVLVGAKQRMAVLPLALSEWRCDPRGGRLEFAKGKLTLTQECVGRRLYCPLLFDLDRGRSKNERTWRQLTVAEMLEMVASDVAVGYRGQSGKRQWLFYRSLGPAANRTVIGQNIAGEFYAGRLLDEGKMDEWIEIEAVVNDEARMTNDE